MTWPPTIGETLPRVEDAYGVESKLRAYSLNPEHKVGAHKAKVFRRTLAITLLDVGHLADQLLVGIRRAPISDVRDNSPYGLLCEVLVRVRGVNDLADRSVLVTTSWEYRTNDDAPRLVSAYIEA